MDEGEVSLVVGIDQVMVVGVHLNRGKLTLVHNVLGGQRANVKALRESTRKTCDEL